MRGRDDNNREELAYTELPDSIKAGEGYDDLIAAQFLVPEDRDECEYYNSISSLMRAYRRKRNIRGYIILPTLGCNARCVYCYEEGRKQVVMNPETVEQTIRFILDQSRGDNVRLSWFGGEPLLGVSAIDRISEALREADLEFRSRMTSNGSLITPESRFGDIWHGTTDEGARKEFCRMDRTREMCRTCPLLPDCTSFASCPWRDTQCRELHTMMAVDELRRMVDKKTVSEAFDDVEEDY